MFPDVFLTLFIKPYALYWCRSLRAQTQQTMGAIGRCDADMCAYVCVCVRVCVCGIVQLLLLDFFFLSLSATLNLTQQKIEAPAECKSMLL